MEGRVCVSGRSIHDFGPRGRRMLQEIGHEVERREGPISGKSNFIGKSMRLRHYLLWQMRNGRGVSESVSISILAL